ncbi:hypothetical protein LR48_Vigan03g177000 [Vigna angularis]|uniref:Uncharacterized protein n=1 Tax=Phaseolus angularis TaxID=3914 RepID=A0A0L9U6D5_PHAAN|nr:hypothetical protein LR48_Vigan03g177000 [Vigna angularis]
MMLMRDEDARGGDDFNVIRVLQFGGSFRLGFWGWLRFLAGFEGEIEVDACQDIKDDGDGVKEIGVFTVENGGEDELSRVLSVFAIWMVDGRMKEFSRWSEVTRGGASMEVMRFTVVAGRRWLCS